MAVSLSAVAESGGTSLTPLIADGAEQVVSYNGKRLAVCLTSSGTQVLAREQERGVLVNPDAPVSERKRDRASGVERFWKATPSLADMRDAVLADLIAL